MSDFGPLDRPGVAKVKAKKADGTFFSETQAYLFDFNTSEEFDTEKLNKIFKFKLNYDFVPATPPCHQTIEFTNVTLESNSSLHFFTLSAELLNATVPEFNEESPRLYQMIIESTVNGSTTTTEDLVVSFLTDF